MRPAPAAREGPTSGRETDRAGTSPVTNMHTAQTDDIARRARPPNEATPHSRASRNRHSTPATGRTTG